MKERRATKVNSLLKEVISEVIKRDVKNPHLTDLLTITDVEITQDLHHAKVYVSVIGDDAKKKQTMDILNGARGYIGIFASKKVKLRFFPNLTFKLDEGVEKQIRIEELIKEMHKNDSPTEPDQDQISDDEPRDLA